MPLLPSHPPVPVFLHPVAWKLQIFSADGSVIAELARAPHQPLDLKGDPDQIILRTAEISRALKFFTPQHCLN